MTPLRRREAAWLYFTSIASSGKQTRSFSSYKRIAYIYLVNNESFSRADWKIASEERLEVREIRRVVEGVTELWTLNFAARVTSSDRFISLSAINILCARIFPTSARSTGCLHNYRLAISRLFLSIGFLNENLAPKPSVSGHFFRDFMHGCSPIDVITARVSTYTFIILLFPFCLCSTSI